MQDKQIYDLTLEDIKQNPVWYFPMDETVEDECTVRPLNKGHQDNQSTQVIIRSQFEDSKGTKYLGYIYWSPSDRISIIQPTMFFAQDGCINYWNGIIEPSWDYYKTRMSNIEDIFPIRFESESHSGFEKLSGEIKGLYFMNKHNEIELFQLGK